MSMMEKEERCTHKEEGHMTERETMEEHMIETEVMEEKDPTRLEIERDPGKEIGDIMREETNPLRDIKNIF